MRLPAFLDEVSLCMARRNGPRLGELFKLDAPHGGQLVKDCRQMRLGPAEDLDSFKLHCLGNRRLGAQEPEATLWGDVVACHLRARMRLQESERDSGKDSERETAAFPDQVVVVQTVQRLFMTNTRWMLPLVYAVNDDLYALARGEEQLQECGRVVNKTVTVCLNDRGPVGESRKWGVYRMTTLLFRIYFKLDQLNLCGNVLRAFGNADLPDATRYPAAQLVAFRYWLGRYYFVNEEYGKAEEQLYLAFAHCPDESPNKQRILHFLLPVRILQGALYPGRPLLQRHGFDREFYLDALVALRRGDLGAYLGLLESYGPALQRLGTFLVWEKLQLIGYRNLLRKAYLLLGSSSRIPLAQLSAPLRGMDADAIGCYVANLIDRGMLKGYISQEKATLVLSQKDPFPSLTTARLSK